MESEVDQTIRANFGLSDEENNRIRAYLEQMNEFTLRTRERIRSLRLDIMELERAATELQKGNNE